MEKKIRELDEGIKATDTSAALQADESANLTEIFGALSTNNTSSLTPQHIILLSTVIDRWPSTQSFPGKLAVIQETMIY